MIDALLVNGNRLENAARIVQEWDEARGIGRRRSSNLVVPNRDGEVWIPKARDAKVFTVGMTILGCDPRTGTAAASMDERRRRFNANWRDFARLIAPDDRPLRLTRILGYPNNVTEELTAQAEIDGDVYPAMISPDAARVAVSFKLLDGVWFGEVGNSRNRNARSGNGEFALTVPGDALTWRLILTFLSGTGEQTLVNRTTGDSVTFTGNTNGVPAVLDVARYRAMRGEENVVSKVTTSDRQISPYWMTLAPGDNAMKYVGDGSVRVEYQGAYQ